MNIQKLMFSATVAVALMLPHVSAVGQQYTGPKQRMTKTELSDEMKRLETEIWNLSLVCAGEAAVAPLQAQLNELGAKFRERENEPRNPLDQGGDICASATVIPSIPYTDAGTTVGYGDDYATQCYSGGSSPDVVYRFTPNMDMT